MALYKLILVYDGTDFSGFQRQGKTRTVQGVLEEVLQGLGWQEKALLFAGRTDAGVHASGQVASFSLDWHHSSADLMQALNARLPGDVSVTEIEALEAEFHPRYDASSRTYRYTINQQPVRNALKERFAWRVWPVLPVDMLNETAKVFLGQHDFCAFGRAMKAGGSTVREIYQSRWDSVEDSLVYTVEANAFLYHMVRRLVYIQVAAASGRLELPEIEAALDSGKRIKPGLAPAHGLELAMVKYDRRQRVTHEDEEN